MSAELAHSWSRLGFIGLTSTGTCRSCRLGLECAPVWGWGLETLVLPVEERVYVRHLSTDLRQQVNLDLDTTNENANKSWMRLLTMSNHMDSELMCVRVRMSIWSEMGWFATNLIQGRQKLRRIALFLIIDLHFGLFHKITVWDFGQAYESQIIIFFCCTTPLQLHLLSREEFSSRSRYDFFIPLFQSYYVSQGTLRPYSECICISWCILLAKQWLENEGHLLGGEQIEAKVSGMVKLVPDGGADQGIRQENSIR